MCVIESVVFQLSPSCSSLQHTTYTRTPFINETHLFNVTPGVHLSHLYIYWSFLHFPPPHHSLIAFPFLPFIYFCLMLSFRHHFFSRTLILFVSSEFGNLVLKICRHLRGERPGYRNWPTFVSDTGTRMEDRTHGREKCPVSSCIQSQRTKPSTPSQWSNPTQETTRVL